MNRACLAIIFGCLASGVLLAADDVYVVKLGDTLSKVVHEKIGGKLYGKTGALRKVLSANPQLKDADRIAPGQKIRLSEKQESLAKEHAEITNGRAPSSMPTAAETASLPEEEVGHSAVLGLGYRFVTLSATDPTSAARATLYSKYDVRLSAAWHQAWAESFSTYQSISLRKIDFERSANASKSLVGTQKTLASMDIGAVWKLGDRIKLKGGSSIGHELFVTGVSSSTVGVEKVPVVQVGGSAAYEFLKKGKTSVHAFVGAAYVFGASPEGYSVSSGVKYLGGLSLSRQDGGRALIFDAGFEQRNQNTSFVKSSEQGFFGTVSLAIPLFSNAEK